MDNFSRSQKNYDDIRANEAADDFVEAPDQKCDRNGDPIGADEKGFCTATNTRECWRFEKAGGGCTYRLSGKCENCFILMELGLHTEDQ